MMNEEKKPRKYDAVLGGDNPPPVNGLVLGGIAGVERRLFSQQFATQLDAVSDALNYGDEGIELIVDALQKSSEEFRYAAAKILKQHGNLDAKQALLDHNPYLFCTTLKALFIGDSGEDMFRKSYLNVFDIRPILEAYPNLEVLQVCGHFGNYPLECEDLKHDRLKTLIIETADISDRNLTQICNLDLPSLEYLEIWLGRWAGNEVKSLDRILNTDPFPWLKYLGLKSGEQSDLIAQAIVNSPVLKHLYVLDLSLGSLTDNGVEALLNCPEIEQLDTLDISYNAVSEGAIACLSELNINLIANNQANDPYYGHRYSTLHE